VHALVMNAVVTIGNIGDTITLVGTQASELHPGDFHFVDASLSVPPPTASAKTARTNAVL
jgi:hypothetical protein